jgi:hypothetical protein
MSDQDPAAERRCIYLDGEGPRILDNAVIAKTGDTAWLDLQVPGLLLRIALTRREVAEMIEVLSGVLYQFREEAEKEAEIHGGGTVSSETARYFGKWEY